VGAELVWIASRRLLEAGVDPWIGVPLWIAAPGWEAANALDVSRATSAGFAHRPLVETIQGAWAHPGDDGKSGLSEDAERDLLARVGEGPWVGEGPSVGDAVPTRSEQIGDELVDNGPVAGEQGKARLR
jgi:hypothetical protein